MLRQPAPLPAPPALWGGVECSVVRIEDEWRDQVRETGHYTRGVRDVGLIAELGIRTVRYPVLWEWSAPGLSVGSDWQSRQLDALHRRGIAVVAGLLHHGSGPPGTDLLDPLLPERLAAHAVTVAERYPAIQSWAVVNEPQTTARFSCLYGLWYPHLHEEAAFLRAVANQCRAVLLSTRAIRARSPAAKFLQTEDIGRVFATAPLRGQAEYENSRRWLSLDLLFGRVGRDHPWRTAMEAAGVPARHLDELATGEAAPDLVGVNYYVTSDRFLDHRLARYPARMHGGNAWHAYVDTEAARAPLSPGLIGWEPRLRDAWRRYQCPIVLSEVHLGCEDSAESVRWLMEAWQAACTLRSEDVPVEAVTAWALFGLVDWDSMLRERRGRLEAGPLTPLDGVTKPGLLASAIAGLARNGAFYDPCLSTPGWWRRDERMLEPVEA